MDLDVCWHIQWNFAYRWWYSILWKFTWNLAPILSKNQYDSLWCGDDLMQMQILTFQVVGQRLLSLSRSLSCQCYLAFTEFRSFIIVTSTMKKSGMCVQPTLSPGSPCLPGGPGSPSAPSPWKPQFLSDKHFPCSTTPLRNKSQSTLSPLLPCGPVGPAGPCAPGVPEEP